jgi:hypothetical protein
VSGTTPALSSAIDLRAQALREQLQRAEQAMLAKRIGEATGICQDMLESAPDHPPALALLGAIAGHRGDLPRGIALLEQAIGADRSVAAWFGNLSGLYRLAARLPEAVATAREALRLQPGTARFLVTLGKALMDSGEHTEAMAAFCAALAREPSHAEAHLAVGQMLLARGEFQPGWLEYEWRNQLDQAKGTLPGMVAAAWNGMQLPNDRLLLIADQGFGDSLQFARFIPLAAARCQEVLLGCSGELMPVLGALPGVGRSFSRWNEIPGHAAYCLLSSLPFLFNIGPDDLPGSRDYVTADPDRIAAWGARLGVAGGGGGRGGGPGRGGAAPATRTTAAARCRSPASPRWPGCKAGSSSACRSRSRRRIRPPSPPGRGSPITVPRSPKSARRRHCSPISML